MKRPGTIGARRSWPGATVGLRTSSADRTFRAAVLALLKGVGMRSSHRALGLAFVFFALGAIVVADDPMPHDFAFVGPRDVVGWVHRVVFDPNDPQIVYAACDDSIGLYRSDDGGNSFRKMPAYGENRGIDSWSLDIGPDGRLYVGDHFGTGIRVSTDGGESFVQATGEDLDYIAAIDAHPTVAGTAFAAVGLTSNADGQGGNGPPLKDRGFVMKTTDGGLTWQKVGGLPTDAPFRTVWIHPSDPDVILAGRTVDIWRSTDGGASWQQLDLITPIPLGIQYVGAGAFTVSPANPNRILASAIRIEALTIGVNLFYYEIWKSEDRGLTFEATQTPANTWLPYYDIVASPDEDLFYAYGYVDSGYGVLESLNTLGAEWQVVADAPPHAYFSGAFLPGDSGEMIVSAFGVGLYRYRRNQADRWAHKEAGLAGAGCIGFAIVEGEPERWIAGCANVGLQPVLSYSDDYGASWTRVRPEGLDFAGWRDAEGNINNAFLPVLADRSLAGVVIIGGNRMQRSTDGGETWTPIAGTGRTYDLDQGPDDAIYASGVSSVYRSIDNGQTFSPYGDLPCPGVRTRVTPDPVIAEKVYASCAAEDPALDGFFVRADSVAEWVRLNDPPAPEEERARYMSIDTFTGDLAVVTAVDTSRDSPGPPDERFFSSNVWVSADGGNSWSNRTPPFVCAIAMSVEYLPDQAGHLLVAGQSADGTCPGVPGRIWESFDNGQTWRDATANLDTPDGFDQAIHLDPVRPGGIFLSTYYNGFYRWVITPGQVAGLTWAEGSKSELNWSAAEGARSYDVARGLISDLLRTGSFADAQELSCRQASLSVSDPAEPPAGESFYYLVRARRDPDLGSWGSAARGETLTVCP